MNQIQLIEKQLNMREQVFGISAWLVKKYQPKRYTETLEDEIENENEKIFIGGKIKAVTEKAILLAHVEGEDWIAKSHLKVWITESSSWEQV